MSGSINFDCHSSRTYNEFSALLRQDSNRVYKYYHNSEELLYDFDLDVGDTVLNSNNENEIVSSIDSLRVGNTYRKKFNLSGHNMFLIEGIGHTNGFIEPMGPIFDCSYTLICYAANDTTYFPDFEAECNYNLSIKEEPITNKLSIYPNPVASELTIESEKHLEKITLYSVLGNKIRTIIPERKQMTTINIENLSVGTYLVHIIDVEGNATYSKVLK